MSFQFPFLARRAGLTALCLLAATLSFAQGRTAGDAVLQGGLVIDNTLTVGGREFYRAFAEQWRSEALAGRYSLSVHELPSARSGTTVWVAHGAERLYEARLPARRAPIEDMARDASATAAQRVVEGEMRRLLLRDQDLGRADF